MSVRKSILLNLVGVYLFLTTSTLAANAQSVSTNPNASDTLTGVSSRVALVIGNANYPTKPLPFTVNDSTDMAQALSELGFDVTVATNANLTQMREVTSGFVQKAKTAQVALFYFAGHGESRFEGEVGRNFLLPVEVPPGEGLGNSETSIEVTNTLLTPLEGGGENRISILILDACRTSSVTRHQETDAKVQSRYQGGLARMALTTSGTFVAYATVPGTAALEAPDSKHGRFTESLLKHVRTPELTLEQVFKRVRSDVEQKSGFKQSPREESSLHGEQDFYFVNSSQRHGRITRYASSREPAQPNLPFTGKLDLLDNILTTPASLRMHALRELIETRTLNLSVSDAETVLSHFWIPARRRALETMAPQLPASMSLGDVTRLILRTDFPSAHAGAVLATKQPGSLNEAIVKSRSEQQESTHRDIFNRLKSLGKVDQNLQFPQLETVLRNSPSVDRCAKGSNQEANPVDGNVSARGAKFRDAQAIQKLLDLVRGQSIRIDERRELIKTLFENHHIALSATEVMDIVRAFPEDVRVEVLTMDIEKGLPDYLTWNQVVELLKLFGRKERGGKPISQPQEYVPRLSIFVYLSYQGKFDANMSLNEGKAVKQVFQEEASGLWKMQTQGMMDYWQKQMEQTQSNPGVSDEVGMQLNAHALGQLQGAMQGVMTQSMSSVMLVPFLACNQQDSRSIEELVGNADSLSTLQDMLEKYRNGERRIAR